MNCWRTKGRRGEGESFARWDEVSWREGRGSRVMSARMVSSVPVNLRMYFFSVCFRFSSFSGDGGGDGG